MRVPVGSIHEPSGAERGQRVGNNQLKVAQSTLVENQGLPKSTGQHLLSRRLYYGNDQSNIDDPEKRTEIVMSALQPAGPPSGATANNNQNGHRQSATREGSNVGRNEHIAELRPQQ